jgi:hypothetical protein
MTGCPRAWLLIDKRDLRGFEHCESALQVLNFEAHVMEARTSLVQETFEPFIAQRADEFDGCIAAFSMQKLHVRLLAGDGLGLQSTEAKRAGQCGYSRPEVCNRDRNMMDALYFQHGL